MTFTDKNLGWIKSLLIGLFWLGLWQVLAWKIGNPIFLPGPLAVFKVLLALMKDLSFYISIGHSFIKIFSGFILAIGLGSILALVSYKSPFLRELIKLPLAFMKAVPLVCFIILLLLWTRAENLSLIVALIMGLPIISENLLTGLDQTSLGLRQMAKSYAMGPLKQVRYIYFYQAGPYLKREILTASSLMFKAGIAAELIGLPKESIGEKLYYTKVYLQTENLFAWTCVILMLSLVFQKILERILDTK